MSSLGAGEAFCRRSEVAGNRQKLGHALFRYRVCDRHGACDHSLRHAEFQRLKRGSDFAAQKIGDGLCFVWIEP